MIDPNCSVARAAALAACLLLSACSSAPAPTRSGFLRDYSALEPVGPAHSRYISPALADYTAVIIDPVELRLETDRLTPAELAEAADYLRASAERVMADSGIRTPAAPGPGVARLRLAITDIAKSVWWKKIHPAARFAGAGTGGAAMEGEILDSITGEQLAAIVRSDPGNQFNLTAFTTLDDVKSVIDKWAADASAQIRETRAEAAAR